jgi:hypothetical protein
LEKGGEDDLGEREREREREREKEVLTERVRKGEKELAVFINSAFKAHWSTHCSQHEVEASRKEEEKKRGREGERTTKKAWWETAGGFLCTFQKVSLVQILGATIKTVTVGSVCFLADFLPQQRNKVLNKTRITCRRSRRRWRTKGWWERRQNWTELERQNFMKQQREERVRSFNGFLTQDHMMSMKERETRFGKERRERERETETEKERCWLPSFLLISTLWIVCDE